jgi:putative Mg2+ transporter-C (MgtC) family protein
MGLAIGIGFYEGALIGCIFILGSMTLLHRLDVYFMSKTKLVELYVELLSVKSISKFFDFIRSNNMELTNVEIIKSKTAEDMVGLFITIKQKEKHDHMKVITMLSAMEDVVVVEEI